MNLSNNDLSSGRYMERKGETVFGEHKTKLVNEDKTAQEVKEVGLFQKGTWKSFKCHKQRMKV